MRKILFGIFFTLFILALIAAGVFGYLFFNTNNQITTLNADKINLQGQINSLTDELNKKNTTPVNLPLTTQIFQDDGTGAYVKYTSDWVAKLNIKLGDDLPNPFRQIQLYRLNLTKDTAKLNFDIIVSGQDAFPMALTNAQYDIKDFGSNVVRYSEKGKNDWHYVTKIDVKTCKDFPGASGAIDLCVQGFFPGFTKKYPVRVELLSSNPDLINQADGIVMSSI